MQTHLFHCNPGGTKPINFRLLQQLPENIKSSIQNPRLTVIQKIVIKNEETRIKAKIGH